MDRCVFIHIPRTSGTSTITRISEQYPPEKVSPYSFWDQYLDSYRNNEINKYDILGGHINFMIYELLNDRPNLYFTILRNPVERTISHYNFITRPNAQHYLKEHITGMSLKDFVFDDLMTKILTNLQTRYIGFNYSIFEIEQEKYFDSVSATTELIDLGDWPSVLRLAKKRLKTFAFVGIKELHCESLKLIRDLLSLPHKEIIEKAHKKHRQHISRKIYNRIRDITQEDHKLYRHGLEIFLDNLRTKYYYVK